MANRNYSRINRSVYRCHRSFIHFLYCKHSYIISLSLSFQPPNFFSDSLYWLFSEVNLIKIRDNMEFPVICVFQPVWVSVKMCVCVCAHIFERGRIYMFVLFLLCFTIEKIQDTYAGMVARIQFAMWIMFDETNKQKIENN